MNEILQIAIEALKKNCRVEVEEFRGEVTFVIEPGRHEEGARILHDEFGFDMLLDETAVDYWPEESPRFHLVYHVYSTQKNLVLCVRVPIPGANPSVPTLEKIYPNANWKEREVWDMFGIHFDGHSDMRRIIMPYDWEGHPLRKDYPLGYEEVQFTFNFNEIDLRKPKGKL